MINENLLTKLGVTKKKALVIGKQVQVTIYFRLVTLRDDVACFYCDGCHNRGIYCSLLKFCA